MASKRHLSSTYRSHHGLETQYNTLQHMSNAALWHPQRRNDSTYQSHVEQMKAVIHRERRQTMLADNNIQSLRDDFTSQLAYQYVYRNHNFRRQARLPAVKKPRPSSDKPPDLFKKEKQAASRIKITRPLGSIRQLQEYRDELKIKLPPIKVPIMTREEIRASSLAVKQLPNENMKTSEVADEDVTKLPHINGELGVEVKFLQKAGEDDKGSLYSAPAGQIDSSIDYNTMSTVNTEGQIMQQIPREVRTALERSDKHRILPVPPNSAAGKRNDARRRMLPQPPNQSSTFLEHRTEPSDDSNLLIRRGITDFGDLSTSKQQNVNGKVEYLQTRAPGGFKTSAITDAPPRQKSAMQRKYEELLRQQQMRMKARRDCDTDNGSIVIRQLPPQPRVQSPVSRSRNEYGQRSSSPHPPSETQTSCTGIPDNEIIPSVSRPSSYKNLSDIPPEIKENAHLTAAQRIEKEKLKRHSAIHTFQDSSINRETKLDSKKTSDIGSLQTFTRMLPPKLPSDKRKIERRRNLEHKLFSTLGDSRKHPMGNTSASMIDRDTAMIYSVRDANIVANKQATGDADDDATNTIELCEDNTEPDESTQNLLQQRVSFNEPSSKTATLWRIPTPFSQLDEDDSYTFVSKRETIPSTQASGSSGMISKLTGRYIQIRQRNMNYSHEQYSRTTEARRHQEMKTKNRRKQQLKNAKLAEESSNSKPKNTDSERPPTRVSFNENVMVFQTI